MLNEKLLAAMQQQVNAELYSSYLYLAMSSWAEYEGWKGIAHWLQVQAQEELVHGMVLHKRLLELGEHSTLTAIDAPPSMWKEPFEVFEAVVLHEQKITAMINALASIAMDAKDHTMYMFLERFLDEQVEEESNVNDLLTRLRRIKDAPAMLDQLDRELATRVFTMPFGLTTI